MRIRFESETCGRCGGTGLYPSSAWEGKCLRCKATGRTFTQAGAAAMRRYHQWAEAALAVPVSALRPGMRIRVAPNDRARTVVAIEPDTANSQYQGRELLNIRFKHLIHGCIPANSSVMRLPTTEELRALAPTLGGGAVLTDEAVSSGNSAALS